MEGDLVEIPTGSRILLDESTPNLKAILVSGGVLKVKDSPIQINTEYIIVTKNGKIEIGTEFQPITKQVTINLGGKSAQQLPLYGSKQRSLKKYYRKLLIFYIICS